MDEHQVRALVRQAIARHLRPAVAAPVGFAPSPAWRPPAAAAGGISHARFHLERPAGEVECLIEPTVTCNHCGYCQCYGH
jgi:hypothetical protein